jgi:hypothetical protein
MPRKPLGDMSHTQGIDVTEVLARANAIEGDATSGGATAGRPSMTHDEFSALAELPKAFGEFVSEIRQQFSTLGEQILPTLELLRTELHRLQLNQDRTNNKVRTHDTEILKLKSDVLQLQLQAAADPKATRRAPLPRARVVKKGK